MSTRIKVHTYDLSSYVPRYSMTVTNDVYPLRRRILVSNEMQRMLTIEGEHKLQYRLQFPEIDKTRIDVSGNPGNCTFYKSIKVEL